MFGLGISEILIIAVIILFIFGARRLPEIGRGLGKTIKELKNVSKDLKGEAKKESSAETEKSESSEQDTSAESKSIKEEIESIPGVKEVKTVKETASQVRKWWKFMKH
jgi:sec-independent protein translocase protein TatA